MDPEDLAREATRTYRAGDYNQALKVFSEARHLFHTSGLPLRAAEMDNNLCVCLLELDRAQEALTAVKETPNIFHNEGNLLLEAQALGNRAMAKAVLSQLSEAEADYHTAAELFREIDHHEGLQYTMQALSKIQLQQGRPMEALDAMQSVLNTKTRPSLRDRFLSWLFKLPLRFFNR